MSLLPATPSDRAKFVRTLGANDGCTGLLRDVRHVEHVVDVCVRDQNEIRALKVGIDHGSVRLGDVGRREQGARVGG